MFQERYNRLVLPFFFLFDTIVVVALYETINNYFGKSNFNISNTVIVLSIWVIISFYTSSYRVPRVQNFKGALLPAFYSWCSFTLFLTFFLFLDIINLPSNFSQGIFIIALGIIHPFISLARFQFFHSYRLKGHNIRYAVLLGDIKSDRIQNIKIDGLHFGYRFIKAFANSSNYLENLKNINSRKKIDIIFLQGSKKELIDIISSFCDDNGIRLKILLSFSQNTANRAGLDILGGFPVMDIRHEPLLYLGNKTIKRIVDIIMSIISIVLVLSWLPIIVKIAQIIFYPGPLFFVQDRTGRDGKVFKLFKFRTMYVTNQLIDAQRGESEKTKKNDDRVPFFGRLLRSSNLDEYPQFINVLLGSMSTVGPRPHMLGEDNILEQKVNRYRIRRFVKPGITGWAAINGLRGGTDNMELMLKRTELDIWYLENWSILLDIKIISVTFCQMLTLKIPKAF
ncbi:sugar transferase [Candidatus Marinimicrobia bacterium]|nr:sugar transferase [Candidatus Neomarinimicrobiota bacterium]